MTFVVDRLQKYLEGENKTLNPDAMLAAVERLKRTLVNQFSSDHGLRSPAELKLYPSEAGKCIRQIAYKALGIPGEPMSGDVRFKLAMGDMVELVMMYLIVHSGVKVTDNNTIRDIRIGPRSWRGATDGILHCPDGKRNLEVKSASGIGFKMTVSRGVDDNFGYLTQASVYMRQLLADKAIDIPETVFLYVDRDSMKLWETIVAYDPALAAAADEKFEAVIDCLNRKKIPERPYLLSVDGTLGLNCSYCSHKHTCWVEPRQVVTFKEMIPQYREKPTASIQLNMRGKKPVWFLGH